MIRRLLLAVALLTGLLVAFTQQASAATCKKTDWLGNCIVETTDPGQDSTDHPGKGGKTETVGQCKVSTPSGFAVPCTLTDFGTYYAPAACYIKPASPVPAEAGKPTAAGYVAYYCRYVVGGTDMQPIIGGEYTIIWLPPQRPTITPEQAARAVAAMMKFQAINIGISQKMSGPNGVGYVGVPVWLWAKDPSGVTVGPQHVQRTYQGLGVTIDAKMTKIVWDLGDGSTVTCGQGTPYTPSAGVAESPTCGHKYTQISKSKPGGKYRITATSYWELDWAAGGQTGVIPLDFTQAAALGVGEIQVVVTNG
ncbi:hypothetical protein ACFV9C_41860 [Kribbella sp. NPDC059898]|uniref:hypothetical protein n=1 Tax=Kribbella sp. NPDC059898 TaxID=3346995 RepID=UPI0036548E17